MTFNPKVIKVQPALVPEDRYARNGLAPTPTAMNRIAHVLNNVSTHMKRPIFNSYAYLRDGGQALSGSPTIAHSVCFHSGENVDRVEVIATLISTLTGGVTPSIYLELDDGSTQTTSDSFVFSGKSATWNEIAGTYMPATPLLTLACSPDTEYVLHIKGSGNAILTGAMGYEAAEVDPDADTLAGFASTKAFEQGKPVYAQDIQGLLEAATALWRHNGAVAFHINAPPAQAIIKSNTTYQNIFTSQYTAFDAAALGVHIRSTYHGSRVIGTVAYKLCCFGSRTAGAGTLSIKIVRSGATVHEWTGIDDTWSPFQSDTFTHAALDEKVDVLVKVSAGTFEIYSLALIEYEA